VLLVGDDLGVQLEQGGGGELRVDRVQRGGDRRGQRRLVDERDHVLRGEQVLRVAQRHQLVADDLRGGGEHVRGLDLAAGEGGQGDRPGLVQRVEGLERQAVDRLQADDAVGAGLELRRAADDELRYNRREVGDRLELVLRGGRLGDRDRVAVLRRGGVQHGERGRELGGEGGVHVGGGLGGGGLVHLDRQQRAVVLGDDRDGALLHLRV